MPVKNASGGGVRWTAGADGKRWGNYPAGDKPTGGFSTSFPAVENPLSQSGTWLLGLADGLDWTNPKVTANGCVASTVPTPNRYSDDVAQLKSSAFTATANQYAQAVLYRAGGYTAAGTGAHECELFLRMAITAHSVVGYEVALGFNASLAVYAFIVRWEGTAGTYTTICSPAESIGSYINAPTAPADGDVWRAEITGTTIKAFQNGTQILQVTDTTYASGQPGLGFWPVDGATPESMGWKSYAAGNL